MRIEFDPLDQDEKEEIKSFLSTHAKTAALDEIYNLARTQLKHGDPEDKEALVRALEEIKAIASKELWD